MVRNPHFQSLVSRTPREVLGREAGDWLALTNHIQKSAVSNSFNKPAGMNMEALDRKAFQSSQQ